MSGLRRIGTFGLLTATLSVTLALYASRRLDAVAGAMLIAAVFTGVLALTETLAVSFRLSRRTVLGLRALVITSAVMVVVVEVSLRLIGTKATYLERSEGDGFFGEYRTLYAGSQPTWFHLYSPNITFTHNRTEFAFPRKTNSIGLCEEEIPRQKGATGYRAIALGDSYTEGVGTAYETTWAQALERQPAFAAHHVRVFNAGVSGSDPWYAYMLLRERLLDAHPDLVMVAINPSDVADVMMRGDDGRFLPDGSTRFTRRPHRWENVYGISYLTRHIVHDVLGYNYMLIRESEFPAEQRKGVDGIMAALQAFSKLAEEQRFQLLVVVHPDHWEAMNKKHTSDMDWLLDELKKRGDIAYVDVLGRWIASGALEQHTPDTLYWPIDGHNNAQGYALLSAAVVARLDELGWPPPNGVQ